MRALLTSLSGALLVLATGCDPNLLRGSVDGHEFDVVSAVHFDFRGVDTGTSLPVHDLILWLMPVEDACSAWPALQADLEALYAQLDEGQDPNAFCVEWADRWQQFNDNEGFWIQQYRIQAQPRPEDQTEPDDSFPWFDEDGEEAPRDPYFDATFAWHEAPTLDRCAAVFAGTDWTPTEYAATGGDVTLSTYVEDERIQGSIVIDVESQDDAFLSGAFDSTFCPAAGEFPLGASFTL